MYLLLLKKPKAVIRMIHSSKRYSFVPSEIEVFSKKSNLCKNLKVMVKFLKGIDLNGRTVQKLTS